MQSLSDAFLGIFLLLYTGGFIAVKPLFRAVVGRVITRFVQLPENRKTTVGKIIWQLVKLWWWFD